MVAALLLLALAAPSIDEGFLDLYHLRFNQARGQFQEWQKQHPADPMGPAAEAASHLFEEFERHGVLTTEFFLDDDTLLGGIRGAPDEARMRRFRDASARARKLAEALLARNGTDPNALLAVTVVTGMQADAASLIEKRQLESLKLIRQAERHGRLLLEASPTDKDGFMALGAASYIISCLPLYKRALLRIGGIQADKERGMFELNIAAVNGRYLRPYAKIMLALACLREQQPERARTLMAELTAEFPASELFRRERVKVDKLTLPAAPVRPSRTAR